MESFKDGIVTRTLVTVVALVVCSTGIHAQPRGIQRVAWLQGCWETSSPQRVIEEQWMAPRGANMVGMSRTVRGDALAAYEFLIVRESGERLEYESHPSGQNSATFLSSTVNDSMVLFENPQHDFPQRIGYRRDGPDSLLAWIEGTDKGQSRRIEFPYRRVSCAGR
jgi:hypothetical protein